MGYLSWRPQYYWEHTCSCSLTLTFTSYAETKIHICTLKNVTKFIKMFNLQKVNKTLPNDRENSHIWCESIFILSPWRTLNIHKSGWPFNLWRHNEHNMGKSSDRSQCRAQKKEPDLKTSLDCQCEQSRKVKTDSWDREVKKSNLGDHSQYFTPASAQSRHLDGAPWWLKCYLWFWSVRLFTVSTLFSVCTDNSNWHWECPFS